VDKLEKKHGVTTDEVEQVIFTNPHIRRAESGGIMKNKRKKIEPIPDKFTNYEEAAGFWDTHDTTDYLDVFRTVDVQTELRKRHYESVNS